MLGGMKLDRINSILLALAGFLTFTLSCSTSQIIPRTTPYKSVNSYRPLQSKNPKEAVGCQQMVDDYCNFLFSPDNLGNVEVIRPKGNIKILQGDTYNDFTQTFYKYSRAKLKNRLLLPKDLLATLYNVNYFNKLEDFLSRKPRQSMSLSERLASERLDYELASLWSATVNETVMVRLSKKFNGYHQVSDRQMPPEYEIESRKIKRHLISEISKALWRDDRNWQGVEVAFADLKTSYLSLIKKLDIPEDVQKNWTARMQTVTLALPGSMPEISDEECSTTTVNAYYYRYLDIITVCAGDFNSEDILLTLAHEMGHVLDISRTVYLAKVNSDFGIAQHGLRQLICSEKNQFTCQDWDRFKSSFSHNLKSFSAFKPPVIEFNRCLKRKPTPKTPTVEDIAKLVRTISNRRYSNLASNDYFLRITKDRMPLRNGRFKKNPYYENPCNYYLWSKGEEPPDDDLSSLIYFTAEYRCNQGDKEQKFKTAIETSKQMTEQLLQATLQMEGEFSTYDSMEREGFASSPVERFADVMGSYALSEYLNLTSDLMDRRAKYLASSSWQCSEPSLNSHFPEESSIEKEYSLDSHAEGLNRRRELLSEPLRNSLHCQKDFEFNECELDFKD